MMTGRVSKAALAAANATMLPTAAPRKVVNNRFAEQRAAGRALKDASPFHARYQHPHDREADKLVASLCTIEQTPALFLVSAILRTLPAEQADAVLRQLCPDSTAGNAEHRRAHKQALSTFAVSRMTLGQEWDLRRALDRLDAEEA